MKVSIIIPCYNVADYIDDALASSLMQTHKDIEIICVDNGSTDATVEYIQGYADRGEVKLMHQAISGAPAARNMGLREASGEWIQFLDADDILKPEKITKQLGLVASNSNAGFVAGAWSRHELDTNKWSEILPMERPWIGLLNNALGNTVANLYRRSSLEAIDGFDESLKSSQEYDLMFRLLKNGAEVIRSLDSLTLVQVRSQGSISTKDIGGNKYRYLETMARIVSYLRSSHPEELANLNPDWHQHMFTRIHLNAVDGYPDSIKFFDEIMPKDFQPRKHKFIPSWFHSTMKRFGYAKAEKLRRAKAKVFR